MLVQPRKAIGILALLDPELPGAKELPSGEWAINRAAALLNFPTQGLKVYIPVWANKSLFDKVELLLNNFVVDQHTVTKTAELTQRTTLFVAPGRFQTGTWQLAYRVTRVSQQAELFVPPLELAVKLEIPAGQDTDPGQGHSNLHMVFRPPEIVQDGVDKDTAKNGVDILVVAVPGSGSDRPYPDIAVGDVCIVSWGGVLVESAPVTQAQIDDPLNNPIIIHISEAIILAVGDSGKDGVPVSFIVRDFADNESEDWCKVTHIVVDTGNVRLIAPILAKTDGDKFNLDQLEEGEDLDLQVWADSKEFAKGYFIIMRIQGRTLNGEIIDEKVSQIIKTNPPVLVHVPMVNTHAFALAKTQARFSYELEHNGSIIQTSKGRYINLIGEPQRLAAVIVVDAVGGAVDPDLPYVFLHFLYDPQITVNTAIELIWSIILSDGSVFEPEQDWIFPSLQEAEDRDGFFVRISGPDNLKPGEGGTLVVSYNLLSEDENGEIVRRPSLPTSPLNIGEPKLELVKAFLLGEQDGALEPKNLPNGISEVTCPNPVNNPTKAKDVVYWQLHDASGKLLFEDNKPLNSLSAGKPVKFSLNAAFVLQYFEAHRGERLSVRYHIVRFETGKTSYSNPLVFVVGEAVELPPPTIDSVKGLPGDVEIPEGARTVFTSVKLSGAGTKGQKVQIKDRTTVIGDADVDPTTGLWERTVTGLSVGEHSFTANALDDSGQVSAERKLTVTEEFFVETSKLTLNGKNLIAASSLGWVKIGDPPGTFALRPARGGTPPYSYTSSAENIASVDSIGTVRSSGSGVAKITVKDSSTPARSLSYDVATSNVLQVLHNTSQITAEATLAWIKEVGGYPIIQADNDFLVALNHKYTPGVQPLPHNEYHITGTSPNGYPLTLRRIGEAPDNSFIWQSSGKGYRCEAICTRQ